MRRYLLILLALIMVLSARANEADSVTTEFAKREVTTIKRTKKSRYPTFGMWRNSYFTTGISTNKPV